MEEEESCPFDFKSGYQDFSMKEDGKAHLTYDDILYHPCEDELNQEWAKKSLAKNKKDLCQLSCSKCFLPVTYHGMQAKLP